MNKELIQYRETIFSKVKRLLKRFFIKQENKIIANEIKYKENFLENIIVNENEDEKRLRELKKLYDNRELEEKNISNEDIDKLIEMYDKEIEELRADTERIKNKIEQIIFSL